MATVQELFLNSVDTAIYAITEMGPETKNDLLQKYDMLASATTYGDKSELLNNLDNYSILLNKTLFIATVTNTRAEDLERFSSLIKMLRASILNTTATKYNYNTVYNKLKQTLESNGGTVNECIFKDSIHTALNTFGLAVVSDDTTEELNEDELELDDLNLDNIFDDEDGIPLDEDEPAVSFAGEADEIEGIDASELLPDEEFDIEDLENTEDTNNNDATASSDNKELRKKLEETFGVDINSRIRTLLDTFDILYKSGFESMPQAGLLIRGNASSSPLIAVKSDRNSSSGYSALSSGDGGTISDVRILDVILNNIPELSKYASGQDGKVIPNIDRLLSENLVCYELHLQFQSANIKYCTGRNSIRRWITETQLEKSGCTDFDDWIKKKNSGGTVRLSKYSDVRKWYKWSLENIIYDALIDAGVQPSYEYAQLENQVIEALYRNLKNAIVVAERNVGVKTEIRISTNSIVDSEKLINNMEATLNVGNDRTIKVKTLNDNNSGILRFNIIFNPAEENKANLFASEVLDNILSSGNAPTWSHALLGKNEDGTYLFWDDFMDPSKAGPSKRCYTIYAASRSGKGVMTSTLVASALCDKKQVFYTDGKPENGACLGEIAWSKGKEAYVFNGTPEGAVPYVGSMEQYTNGLRTEDEIYNFATKLPKALFESKVFTKSDQRKFFGVMRYLKSMLLCSEVVLGRAKGTLPKDEWQVWIFDEMTKMSNNEKDIRKKFLQYAGDKVNVKKVSDSNKVDHLVSIVNNEKLKKLLDKNSETYDEGIDYIYRWLHWNDCIKSNMHSAAVIELGKADMNLIFIFQQASWIPEDCNITTIGAVVDDLDSTKIVGNGGIQPLCKNYGDGTTKGPWVDKINSGKGWWAISEDSDIRSGKVKLFKPFNVFTTKLGPNGLKSTEGFADENESRRYLDGYARSLLGHFGLNPEDILTSAYQYANSAITTLGFANDIKEFIYDYSNLNTGSSANRLEDVGNEDGSYTQSSGGVSSFVDFGESGSGKSTTTHMNSTSDDPLVAQVQQQMRDAEQARQLKFMRTNALKNANLSDNLLNTYLMKFVWNKARRNYFDYSDRSNIGTSLVGACIIYSNLHYCTVERGIASIDEIRQEFIQQIQSGADTEHKSKLALGLLGAYDNDELQYDVLPPQDMMRQWIQMYSQPVNVMSQPSFNQPMVDNSVNMPINNPSGFNTPVDVWSDAYEDSFLNSPEQQPQQPQQPQSFGRNEEYMQTARVPLTESFNAGVCYQTDNRGNIQFRPRPDQNVLVLNPSTFRKVEVESYKTTERFKKKLFESKNGTAYIFKKYWDEVLNEAAKLVGNRSSVTKVTVAGGQFTVNGMVIDISALLDYNYGITLENIFHIKTTFKKFPMIQQMVLDSSAANHLIWEYGDDAHSVWKAFQENKSLQTLTIVSSDGSAINYNRRDFAATANILNQQLSMQRFSIEAEQSIAQKNPRLHTKPVGYMYSVFKNGKTLSGNSIKKASAHFTDKDPKLLRGLGWSGVALVSIGVGAAFGVVGGIMDFLTPKN